VSRFVENRSIRILVYVMANSTDYTTCNCISFDVQFVYNCFIVFILQNHESFHEDHEILIKICYSKCQLSGLKVLTNTTTHSLVMSSYKRDIITFDTYCKQTQ